MKAQKIDSHLGLADIMSAQDRLAGHAIRTPLLSNPFLDEIVGTRVLIKAETLQYTGSFKFRGAWSRMTLIPGVERKRGVVAYSLGNHAQGVAAAARILGMPATIVMPKDVAKVKIEATLKLGANIRLYDRQFKTADAVIRNVQHESNAIEISSCDERAVIAGQGTVGLEMIEDAEARGMIFDDVLVCCGGGGLAAGIATAIGERSPSTRIWAVEPAGFDDTARSLAAGLRLSNGPGAHSICDALLAAIPGVINFEINRRRLTGVLTVTDDEVCSAVRFAFGTLKLAVEPGGAAALAALLAGKPGKKGKVVGVVLTGGNIDQELLLRILVGGI